MSNCQPTTSPGAIFETYGEYRQQKFCDNICAVNGGNKEKCIIEDASCAIIFKTTNNAGNIHVYSNFIDIDCRDGSFNITTGETSTIIQFKDASINTAGEDLSFITDDFNFDMSENIYIDCSDNIDLSSINNININSQNLDISTNFLNINGLSKIYIDSSSVLNITIDNSASISIEDKTFIFEASGNVDSSYIIIKDMSSNNTLNRIITISGDNYEEACTIL